jgi:hypothetical protein
VRPLWRLVRATDNDVKASGFKHDTIPFIIAFKVGSSGGSLKRLSLRAEKRMDIAMAVQHAGHFDTRGAFAIKDQVVADSKGSD